MHVDPYIILGGAVVGFLLGMTGTGGGALRTPMLILVGLVHEVVPRPVRTAAAWRRERAAAVSAGGLPRRIRARRGRSDAKA